uniref:Uncharacterized protein n=1 Tax=viral metagenome TaxID=1070528 RepID=A0A6M3LLX3_9ZZZZ
MSTLKRIKFRSGAADFLDGTPELGEYLLVRADGSDIDRNNAIGAADDWYLRTFQGDEPLSYGALVDAVLQAAIGLGVD